MADLLTLEEARVALRWGPTQRPGDDAELQGTYIPAVTETIEAWCGRMEDRTETWVTDGASPITTPWPDTAVIKSVSLAQSTTPAPWSGYELLSGYATLEAGTWSVAAGVLTVTDPSYTAGAKVKIVAGNLPVPRSVVEAAKIILVQLWSADHQSASASADMAETPVGFAIPRRAEQLLNPYWHVGGFR